jgi:glutathione synthase/RimK-type ligase-like ATP-grasp enzyme
MSSQPQRVTPRVALATCAELPDLDPDDRLLLAPLAGLGVAAEAVAWSDPGVDWSGFDLVVLRSTWDYARRRDEFVGWAAGVPRLANPADVVRWNTDKRYLSALASAGVPVVPTEWVAAGDAWALPEAGEWVVKPAVSAGSVDTGRYASAEASHRSLAASHVGRLQAADRLVMVQPYLPAVDTEGETALLFLGGVYSHAIRKGPLLDGPEVGVDGLYKEETITPREPSPAQLAVAASALAEVPGGSDRLLYARVDLIPGPDGQPLLIELELTEPSLFLGTSDGAAARLAEAIAARIH